MTAALVLDAGALIAIERRSTRIQALLVQARQRELSIVVPTPVVAQVIRGGGRQVGLRRFLADSALRYADMDLTAALEVGALLGASGTSDVGEDALINHVPAVAHSAGDLQPPALAPYDPIRPQDPGVAAHPAEHVLARNSIDQRFLGAFVAVCARRLGGCPVVTSDPDDLARLDSNLPLIAV